jgi:hypothetical protein
MPYQKTVWSTGDTITATLANHWETQYDEALKERDKIIQDAGDYPALVANDPPDRYPVTKVLRFFVKPNDGYPKFGHLVHYERNALSVREQALQVLYEFNAPNIYQRYGLETSKPAWVASTSYALGNLIMPTSTNENGIYYECTTAGTSGSTEPTWPTAIGNTVTDGTAAWTAKGKFWSGWVEMWTSGNDGSGSGMDADLLDGFHESTFMRKNANSNLTMDGYTTSFKHASSANAWFLYDTGNNLQLTMDKTGGAEFNFKTDGANFANASFEIAGNPAWHSGNFTPGDKVNVAGDTMTGPLDIDSGSNAFRLKPATFDHVYMSFYADSAAPTVRSGYFGFGSAGTTTLTINNETGGDINLIATGNLTKDGNKIWHAGNDGAGSGLDADLVQGVDLKNQTFQSQLENIGDGVQNGLNVLDSATPDMNVHVQTGVIYMPSGQRFNFSAVTTKAVNAADATYARKDIIYVSEAGVITYAAGTPASSPTEPALPSGAHKLCVIDVPAGDTAIEQAQITDTRTMKKAVAYLNESVQKSGDTMTGTFEITNQGDLKQQLRFNTERPWHFRQGGTGAGTTLDLAPENDEKSFRILTESGNVAFNFHPSNTGKSNFYIDGNEAYHKGNITAGTAAPSGGQDGDIYIQYE